jgi:hypothetical protein
MQEVPTDDGAPEDPTYYARRLRVDRIEQQQKRMRRKQNWILYLVIASLVTGLMEISPKITSVITAALAAG